ncbi:hypothetical protein T492DRAFT_1064799 [Pavlovales sp. CCMP2436]|nr:hypothetical protein T492DRAFT_1064799 [Pavlovales sp. CCMP2436]
MTKTFAYIVYSYISLCNKKVTTSKFYAGVFQNRSWRGSKIGSGTRSLTRPIDLIACS